MWAFIAGVGIGVAVAAIIMYVMVCYAFKDWGW